MVQLHHLDSFVVLAEELNFTHAARRLGISQSALSNRIQRLERDVGSPLIERNSRRNWQLTEAGAHLFREVRAGLERLETAVADVQRLGKGETGELQIGVAPSLPSPFLAGAVAAFRGRSPDVRVSLREMSTEEQVAELRRGALDLGLARGRPNAPDLWCEEVAREPLIAAVGEERELAQPGRLSSLTALASECFVVIGRGGDSEARRDLLATCEERGFTPEIACEASLGVALQLVASGEGVALVAASSARGPTPGVRFVRIDDAPTVQLIAVTNPARRRLTTVLFTEVLLTAGRILNAQKGRPAEFSAVPSLDGAGPPLAS